MYVKSKVVMLQVKEKAENCILFHKNKISFRKDYVSTESYLKEINAFFYHLYIINDDNINIRDYVIYKHSGKDNIEIVDNDTNINFCKKIIASTDETLNLPQPSQEFINKYIEEYNKGNKIEDVLVEYDYCMFPEQNIIKVDKNNTITIKKIKDSWNREEVIELLTKCWKAGYNSAVSSINEDRFGDEDKSIKFTDFLKNNL